MHRWSGWLRRSDVRTVLLPSLGITVLSILTAAGLSIFLDQRATLTERAERLSARGDFEGADRLYSQSLSLEGIHLETLIARIDNLALIRLRAQMYGVRPGDDGIRRLLEGRKVDRSTAILGSFWYDIQLGDGETDETPVLALAEVDPPVRWANHLLGRSRMIAGDSVGAAERFEWEGLSFPAEASDDLERALRIWSEEEEWDVLRERVSDPRFSSVAGPWHRVSLALHDRDWATVLLWLWPASLHGAERWPLFLAVVAGILWFLIASRMGRIEEGGRERRLLYISAFLLGILSVYPTLVLIIVEEEIFGLAVTGQPVADAIYFIFGVGLREELSKLLLFLPLLPVLNRRGSRIEALACGALVGLGFAAEENINYFRMMDASAALGRFLTANFLHMALTGMVGVAAYDASSTRRRPRGSLNEAFIFAMIVHGAYDFFLVSPVVEGASLIAMILFVLISQRFLRELLFAAPDAQRGALLRIFVLSLAILTGLSYIYAATLVGPLRALGLMVTGALGVAILIYMFVRELGT
ncbi:MAG TPA: PrsW family glutamic-type intramembrane protease [Thermoanaerobaculia bacterium]|nr:PrsW family glutamic-type intramembrane protease [Thermoanaerobaculia bacterium]